MAHFPPSVLAYLRKVQALLRFVLRRPAARNVLQHLWSFILRRLQSCTDLLSRPRPEVTARKDQRMNAGSRTTPKSTHNTGGTFPAESSCSQLPIPICTPLDPSSVEVTSQETDPPAPELSYQSSPQPTNFQDTSSVRDPLLRADNSRETIPLALMGFCWNSSQYTDLKGASSSTQQLVPQPERGESMKLPSDPPSEPHTPAVRASHLDLLASAVPVVPEQLQRYNREFKRNQTHYIEAIQPRKLDYTEPGVQGWTRIVHPDGAPYFFSERPITVHTDTDLSVPRHLTDVEDFIRVLVAAVTGIPDLSDHSTTLVLQLKHKDVPGRTEQMCFYYFIDHSKQLIFWVHPVNVGDICGIIRGVKNEWQLGYAIETHYWHHCELYPSHIRLKPDFYPKLRGILIYTNGDSMVSDAPPGPFESTDLQRLLDLVSAVGGQVDTYDEYLITVLAKAMRLFYQYRFLNSHGQFGARLGGGRSVFARKRVKELPVSIFLMGANIALFGALIDHYRRIQKIWVDGIVDESRWETYISSLRTEWNNYIVFSTVMLAVDVSFLAVPGVQAASGLQQPVAATMTYASVIFSAMALLAASFLTRQAGQFVRMTENTYETEVLAAMFSLPRAFLNLATYSFVIALISLVISLNNMAALGIMLAIMVIYYSSVNLLLGCIAIIRLFPWCGGQSEATSS